ncbi:solute carrier family 28 member 3 [Bactrocera dorsalis]|uniref:Sodium/nucleoside cotransporter n=1 Tax=Bactrocera dorsalis TaxID=27457 RepID=A0ABM3JHY5_BACDO|nr:solute carrier family 28 member 3 [Bactrocera dorsalis]XP_049308838.1 solute carrier family 28 member 3 [Bactrocera dorsalis]XP_049308839.1 solute carrier family 28 member 3 [Bactrocera dorsalis]
MKMERGQANTAYEIGDPAENVENADDDVKKANISESTLKSKSRTSNIKRRIRKASHKGLKVGIHLVVAGYFAYATYHYIDVENNECDSLKPNELCGIQFCSGYGLLVLLLAFIYLGLLYFQIIKPKVGRTLHPNYIYPLGKRWKKFSRTRLVSGIMLIVLIILLAIFLYFATKEDRNKLRSLLAPCLLILAGYVFSSNRNAINWRTVISGIVCQFILGILCIRWDVGRKIFECLGDKVATFLSFSDEGSRFVFGDTIIDDGIFAFAILPVIFFFSFFISILHYWGVMQWIVMKLGWLLQQILGTTVCESVTSAANIFLGMSESPMLIRPYLTKLTSSELHSIMASGFATVSGTVLAAYLSFGASAAHLITSSVMAAPAALAFSKLYMPETEESQTSSKNIQLEKSEDSSILDAASNGANNAIPIVAGIIANIVAFVAFVAFLNGVVNWLCFLVGLEDIDFEWIFSKLFIPLVWTMGVPYQDCNIVAKIVATKSIINEFVAYERLGEYIKSGELEARSISITTFAICGFANPGALGILIGTLSAMAPNRRYVITSVAMRAFVVGSIVCFVSASFAGLLLQEEQESRLYAKFLNAPERKNITIAIFKSQ